MLLILKFASLVCFDNGYVEWYFLYSRNNQMNAIGDGIFMSNKKNQIANKADVRNN